MATPAYTGSNAVNSFNAASGTAAMSASVTSGNSIIALAAYVAGGTPTFSKSAGTATIGTPVAIGSAQNTGGGGSIKLFSIPVTGSGTLTLQLSVTSSTFNGFTAMEWTNLSTTLDGTPPTAKTQAFAANGTFTGNSITTAQANSVVFGAMTNDGGNATWGFTAGSGWSLVGDGAVTGNPSWLLYAVEASASSYAPTGTVTDNGGSGTQLMYTVALQASGSTSTNTLNPGADTLIISDPPLFALNYLLTENATLSDSRTMSVGPVTSDGLTLADLAPTIWPALVLSDPLTLSDVAALTLLLTLGPDGLTVGEALVAAQGQNGTDALALAEIAQTALGPTIAEALSLSDVLATAQATSTTDSLTLADVLNAAQSGQLSLSDSLTLSDVVIAGLLAQFSDSLTLSEALLAAGLVQAIDGLTLADALAIIAQATANNIIAIDGLTLMDTGATTQGGIFSDPLTLVEVIASGLRPSLGDALALSEAMTTALSPILVDPLTLSDAIVAAGLVSAVDGLSLAEAWAIVNAATNYLNATDTLRPVDSFSAAVGLLAADPLLLTDLISHTLRPSLSDALALAEALSAVGVGQLALSDTLSVSDTAAVTLLASFSDPLVLAESLIASGLVSALDGLTVSEAWNIVSGAATVISVYLNATDTLSVSDALSAQTLIPALIAAIRRHFVVPNRAFHFAVPLRQTHFVVPQRSFHFIVSTTPYALPVTPGDSDNTIGSTENLLSYDIDFGPWLQTGEGVNGCSVTCSAVLRSNPTFDMSANAAAFVINSAISGSKVVGTVDPHNALIGARYTLLFSATTSLGRTLTKPLAPLDCDR